MLIYDIQPLRCKFCLYIWASERGCVWRSGASDSELSHREIQDLLISDSASLFFISKEQTHPGSSWMLCCRQQVTSIYP